MNWKTTTPTVGVYVASTSRSAGFVRHWDGSEWSTPTAIHDVHLNRRTLPDGITPRAELEPAEVVEWLEQYATTQDGMALWNGLQDKCPVAPDLHVGLLFKNHPLIVARAGDQRWSWEGSMYDIVAYRVVDRALHHTNEATPVPARERIERELTASPASISLQLVADSFPSCATSQALRELGEYQDGGDSRRLLEALRLLGLMPWLPQQLR